MQWPWSKSKTLEERAKEQGITILNGQIPTNLATDYTSLKNHVRGSGKSVQEAEKRLIENAVREEVVYLADIYHSEKIDMKKVSAMGYVLKTA